MNKLNFLLFFSIFYLGALFAQHENLALIGNPVYNQAFVVCILQDSIYAQTLSDLQEDTPQNAAFYLINGSVFQTTEIRDSLNELFNIDLAIDNSRVYLIKMGDNSFIGQHSDLHDEMFADKRSYRLEDLAVRDTASFNSLTELEDWETLLSKFMEKHKFSLEIDKIRERALEFKYTKKGNKIKEFRINYISPFLKNSEAAKPAGFLTYNYESRRKISENIEFANWFGLSFKRPKPEDDIRSQVRGQIDIGSIIEGTAEEQEINIQTTISGHAYANLAIQGRYLFDTKGVQPYVGLGLSYLLYAGVSVPVDTTLFIDLSEGLSGGGGFEIDRDNSDFAENADPLLVGRLGIPITAGFYRKMKKNDRWAIDFHASYDLDPRMFGNKENVLSTLSIGAGISLRIYGKKSKYYNYFRLKDKKILKP